MSDYIKREDAIGIVKNLKRFSCFGDDGFVEIPMVYCELMQVASADVAPVRHGHWIEEQDRIICSECGARFRDEIIYMQENKPGAPHRCLECGAIMEKGEDYEID